MATRTINKSAFVRSLGDIPAAEVIAKAKEKGFTLSTAHVYTIRAAAKRKGGNKGSAAGAQRGRLSKNGPKTNLRSQIDALVSNFVQKILGALREASLNELRDM